jgi:hypothetical protein
VASGGFRSYAVDDGRGTADEIENLGLVHIDFDSAIAKEVGCGLETRELSARPGSEGHLLLRQKG